MSLGLQMSSARHFKIGEAVARFAQWFYTPPGYMPVIRPLIGLCVLGCLPYELLIFSPGCVDASGWRIGTFLLQAPSPPPWLSVLAWCAYALSGVYLLLGRSRHQPWVAAIPAMVLLYYGFVEERAFHSSFTILTCTYLVALLFDAPNRSLSRRLIQISVSCCYFFSALHKLHPEWSAGCTMGEIMNKGWLVRPELQSFLASLHLNELALSFLAWSVIAAEFFLAVAPWIAKLRKVAFILSILLHTGISIVFPNLEIFALVMWTGFLAFFPKAGEEKEVVPDSGVTEATAAFNYPAVVFASMWALVMVVMPLRFYVCGISAFQDLVVDRNPWSHAMFLTHTDWGPVAATYKDASGQWHNYDVPDIGVRTTSEAALLAVARHVVAKSSADEVLVKGGMTINSHTQVNKVCHYWKTGSGWQATMNCSLEKLTDR